MADGAPRASVAHAQPAVHGQDGAGDVAGLRRGEVGDGSGDLVGLGHPPERHGGDELGLTLLAERSDHVGRHRPGSDDVDRDAAGAELTSERASEADQARLGGRIVGLTGRSEQPDDRRDEDDPPLAGAQHPLGRPLDHAEGAGEVGVDDRAEVGLRHPQQQGVAVDGGVADQHFDRAEVLLDPGERVVHLIARRHVALHGEEALGGRRGVVGDGDAVSARGEPLCAGETDPLRAPGDEHDPPARRAVGADVGHRPPPQRRIALAAVIPAPKPTNSTRSPSLTRPDSRASARASGIDADDVFPVRCSTVAAFSIGTPSRLQAASMIRMLAWWGTIRARSSGVTPAWAIDFWALSTMIRTARRNTSLPSICMLPPISAKSSRSAVPSVSRSQPSSCPGPSTASSTTAPEPSPNRIAVLRSSQSVIRARVSVPIISTRREPSEISPWATTSPYTKPLQAALTSNAPPRVPSAAWTVAEVAGTVRSGVVVASTSVSMSPASIPAMSSAARPLSIDRPAVVPPTWRSRMPVRSTIHSSVVSRYWARSSFVTRLGGRAVPQPVMTAPPTPTGIWGMSSPLVDRIRPCAARRWVDAASPARPGRRCSSAARRRTGCAPRRRSRCRARRRRRSSPRGRSRQPA